MTLPPGTRLGPYEVAALIGEGGMGQVYRATDTKLKRQVAIKILPPSVAADHERLARLQRETREILELARERETSPRAVEPVVQEIAPRA